MKKWLITVGLSSLLCTTIAIGAQSPSKVSINQADVKQLMTLKGVGKKRAQAIVTYRKQHGQFHNVSELNKVPGISAKLLKQLQNKLQVS